MNKLQVKFPLLIALFMSVFFLGSCDKDDVTLQSKTFTYQFHNGQTVPSAPYTGYHETNLSADLELEELENGNTKITVTLFNTMDGQTYHTHAHDAADASTTPNGTPYNETPNSSIYANAIAGNGGTVSVSQEASMSYDELVNNYSGFFVVHDPLQAVNTADISTYLIVGSFAREQAETNLKSSTFNYDFNKGQIVPDFAYSGSHNDNLSASISVDELSDGRSRVTVRIMNSMDGMTYHSHAHDMADPATTTNGTPYIETPNGDVFAAPILGNGGTTGFARISPKTYTEITTSYDGFFVVHDPLQTLTTVDPTTYVVLGVFAR